MKTKKPSGKGGPGSPSSSSGPSTKGGLEENSAKLDELDTSKEESETLVLDAAESGLSGATPPPSGGSGGSGDGSGDGSGSDKEGGDKDGKDEEEGGKEAKASGGGSGDKDEKEDGEKPKEEGVEEGEVKGDEEESEKEEGDEAKEGDKESVEGGGGPEGDGDVGSTETEGAQLEPVPEVPEPELATFEPPQLDEEQLSQFMAENAGLDPLDHARDINREIEGIHTEAVTSKQTLMTERDGHLANAETARISADTAVTTAIATGRGRVSGVFSQAGADAVAAANEGIGAVEKGYESGKGQIDTVADGRKGEVKGIFDGAKGNVDSTIETGASSYEKKLQAGAEDLKTKAKDVKTKAKGEGDTKAKEYEGKAKGKSGLDSLHEESKAEVAKDVATGAGNAVDMKVKVRTHKLSERAKATAETAVEVECKPLSDDLEAKKNTADQNIEAGRTTAQSKLTANKDGAVETLESARDNSEQQAADENERAQARLDAAETSLKDDAAKMAEEMKNRIEVKAANDAAAYAAVTADVKLDIDSWEGPVRLQDVQGTLESALINLQDSHVRHVEELATLADGAIAEYETGVDTKIDVFDGAVEAQETEARTWAETLVADVKKTATDFTGGIDAMAKEFDKTLAKEVEPVTPAAKALEKGAAEAIKTYETMVTGQFDKVKGELETVAAEELAKIPQQVEEKAQSKTNAKRIAIVSNDIPSLFSAMDGMGTDENGIYGVLRKMSYGQIEALETLWNKYKKHSLRWYFRDEMSGGDLDIAMAYLNHDRARALKLELEDSTGFWNDDEARIEAVMKSASAEEMSTLTTKYSSTLKDVRGNLGGADLDNFNALADTSLSREEAKSKADAIRLHEAMDGMGTDEAKVKQLLEAAKTPEERERLRKYYDEYSGSKGEDMDLDERLDYEFTGVMGGKEDDIHLVKALAKTERNDAEVAAAKVFEAGEGMGTDETAMFDALKSDVGKWDTEMESLQTALSSGQLTGDAKIEAEIKLAELQKKKKDHFETLDASMKSMTGDKNMTMDKYLESELDAGLELKIAQDAKDKGKSDPADLIQYASSGMGTDEEMFKKALQDDQGNPLSKEEIAKIDKSLADRGLGGINAMAESELGGRDAHDVAKLELGKPENADDLKKLVDMDYEFENSGVLGRGMMWVKGELGMSTAMEEMDYAKDQFDAQYQDMVEAGTNDLKFDELAKSDNEAAQLIQELGITSQKSSEAYGKSLSATVDALVTALQLIGGVIATIATAGAASPALAMLIANIAIGTAGIVLKKAAIGDAYGYDQIAIDFVKMASTAALGAAMSKVDKLGKIAEAAGNKGTKMFQQAGNKAGTFFTGKAWEMGPKGTAYLNTFIKSGTETALGGVVTDTYSGLWDEKNYDKGVDHWLGGAAMKGIGGMPQSFVTGGAQGMYGKWAGDRKKDAFMERNGGAAPEGVDPATMTHGSMGADVMYGARDKLAGHVIGHVTGFGNYSDAGKFWEGLVTGGPKAMLEGALDAYGTRKALPKNVARDLENGSMTEAQYDLLHGELTPDERFELGSNMTPSKQPAKIKAFVAQEADKRLQSTQTTGGGAGSASGGGAATYDQTKLDKADAATLGQALNGGLPFDAIKDRSFSDREKILIARLAGQTGKLPDGFLDGVSFIPLLNTPEQRVQLAVDAGWDTLPPRLQQEAKDALTQTKPEVTMNTLLSYKGATLPPDLQECVNKRFSEMSETERVKLGKTFGIADIAQLPPEVRKGVQEAIGSAVSSGQSDDPEIIVYAMQNGQIELTDEGLGKLNLTPEQKLAVLGKFGYGSNLQSKAPEFASDAMGAVLDLGPKHMAPWAHGAWDTLDDDFKGKLMQKMDKTDTDHRLAFFATIPKDDVPQTFIKGLGQDLKYYKVGASLAGGGSLTEEQLARLEELAQGQDTALPSMN